MSGGSPQAALLQQLSAKYQKDLGDAYVKFQNDKSTNPQKKSTAAPYYAQYKADLNNLYQSQFQDLHQWYSQPQQSVASVAQQQSYEKDLRDLYELQLHEQCRQQLDRQRDWFQKYQNQLSANPQDPTKLHQDYQDKLDLLYKQELEEQQTLYRLQFQHAASPAAQQELQRLHLNYSQQVQSNYQQLLQQHQLTIGTPAVGNWDAVFLQKNQEWNANAHVLKTANGFNLYINSNGAVNPVGGALLQSTLDLMDRNNLSKKGLDQQAIQVNLKVEGDKLSVDLEKLTRQQKDAVIKFAVEAALAKSGGRLTFDQIPSEQADKEALAKALVGMEAQVKSFDIKDAVAKQEFIDALAKEVANNPPLAAEINKKFSVPADQALFQAAWHKAQQSQQNGLTLNTQQAQQQQVQLPQQAQQQPPQLAQQAQQQPQQPTGAPVTGTSNALPFANHHQQLQSSATAATVVPTAQQQL